MRKLTLFVLVLLTVLLLYAVFIFALDKYVDSEIKQVNYCSVAEDCVSVGVCNRPCGFELVNANEAERIRELILIQAKQPFGIACSTAQCESEFPSSLACVEGKCQVTRTERTNTCRGEGCLPSRVVTSAETRALRVATFNRCQGLVNETLAVTGTVLHEECGKNCLGGCPNSGPSYCYYGVNTTDDCLLYVKSRITAFSLGNQPEKVFNVFTIGQSVNLAGNVSSYTNHYCSWDKSLAECSYLILD